MMMNAIFLPYLFILYRVDTAAFFNYTIFVVKWQMTNVN